MQKKPPRARFFDALKLKIFVPIFTGGVANNPPFWFSEMIRLI
jgi:hypothetical protein